MSRKFGNSPGWSPEKIIWEKLSSISNNLSWKCVNLDKTRKHLVPGNDAGVYLMCAPPPTNTLDDLHLYTVLYAGQVKKRGLQTRFIEHISKPNAKLRMFLDCYYPRVDFWFAIVHEHTEIDELETFLIDTFDPPCNNIGAPGSRTILARLGEAKPFRIDSS